MAKARSVVHADGTFEQTNYHDARPFASFLPGIAGECGIPIWVFYCNRGQAITSCGVRDKNGAIMEYHPANTAYQRVGVEGFRTFIWEGDTWYEPFCAGAERARQTLRVRAYEVELEEENPAAQVHVEVTYFTLPSLPVGALVRQVRVTNMSRRTRQLRITDGIARLVPGSVTVNDYAHMSNTEAGVIETLTPQEGVLLTRARVIHYDTVTPDFNTTFNFVTSVVRGPRKVRVQMVGDPRLMFGEGIDLRTPLAWAARAGRPVGARQRTRGYMPCGFTSFAVTLRAGETCEWVSAIGNTGEPRVVEKLRARLASSGWLEAKRAENARVIARIQDRMWTVTADPTFDHYCRQTYLDNVLRGGLPVALGGQIFHLFFRKHGDMERDYNWFVLEPTYYSQGNANYRDINQNRRMDVLFHPPVRDTNVRTFVNALQLDGNNPLAYEGTVFVVPDDVVDKAALPGRAREAVRQFAGNAVTPGQVAHWAEKQKLPVQDVVEAIVACARRVDRWGGSDGYWSDHWVYCLDLIEQTLNVYPDEAHEVWFGTRTYTFHDNPEVMLPRDMRFTLDVTRQVVRQHNALARDAEKARMIAARREEPSCVRVAHGQGEVYRTTLYEKMLCLAAVKFATLDPDEVGLEMRGNRPGWNDAMNGLPGLVGSSLNETAELLRLVRMLRQYTPHHGELECFAELGELARALTAAMEASGDRLVRWHARNEALERYLAQTRLGISGAITAVRAEEVQDMLARMEKVLGMAVERARDERSGLYQGYFYYRVTQYRPVTNSDGSPRYHDGRPCVWPEAFVREVLPAFLEPQFRVMGVLDTLAARRDLHRAVLRSPLYDRSLRMLVLNAPLERTTQEIGRANIFPPGWLENRSVWLHMEYKYLLALLRAGLYDEFFALGKDALIPFQPLPRYGRSPLEHASFIASSAHEDKSIHGAGFYARLSGATVEFIQMWTELNGTARMFALDQGGQVRARLQPILPATYFTRRPVTRTWENAEGARTVTIPKNACAFVILGGTLLVYHNPQRRDTFGAHGVGPVSYRVVWRDGKGATVNDAWLPPEIAAPLRAGEVARIDVLLG